MHLLNILLIFVSTYSTLVLAESDPPNHPGWRDEKDGKEAVACEGSTLNIRCQSDQTIKVLRASYGRKSRKICNEGGNKPISNLHCESKKSFDFVDDQCSDRQSCSIAATNTIFGDPCRGTSKYLDVEYKCIERPTYRPRQITSIEKKMACESTDLSISCPRGNEITILRANYGRLSRTICDQDGKAPISDVRCGRSKKSKDIVSGQCDGKQRCNVSANNVVFGDPCFGTYKYLEVSYVCTKDINAGNDDNDDNDRIDDSDLNNDNDDNDRLVILIS